jgi:aspartate aminotransferase-like enzyme
MTPGPTPIPPEVEAAMAEPIVYHRGPEFQAVFARVLERLQAAYRTGEEVVLFTASGTAAMESAVCNLLSPDDRAVVVSAGNFGERFAQIVRAYGAELEHVRYGWGETPDPDEVGARLAELGGATALYCTHCETSTGVVADVRALAAAARDSGAVCVVDAISSLGALPLETDEWDLDVVVSGSQKGLMTPPGLAFAAVSRRARSVAKAATSPRFYLDWERALRSQAQSRPPFTAAVPLVRGLDAALSLLLERGLETAWERARRLGRACREGVKAMGLELYSPDEDRSAVVTAIRVPEGVDGLALVRDLRERFGVTVAGGQGELRGKVVRIGHIGAIELADVCAALAALEAVLAGFGHAVEEGASAARAAEAYAEAVRV